MNPYSTPLVIYTGDPKSTDPLPQQYLSLPGAVVRTSTSSERDCNRCGEHWKQHGWIVTSFSSIDENDCSILPRQRTGFYPS
jgi:hypothetical protein